MKFTPGQLQEALQLSPAAFRHWKAALPPIGGRNGYAPCFTPGDLLAMAVVKSLTEEIGIRVSHLRPLAAELFDHCNRSSWVGLERLVLVIEPLRSRVSTISEAQPLSMESLTIVLPLRPIITILQERFLLGHESSKQE